MIVGNAQQDNNSLDAASTHTLVVDRWHTIPRHFMKLTYASLLLSTLAFIFAIVDNVFSGLLPKYLTVAVLSYTFTLPYYLATLLLAWLQKHQIASIFPFPPSHPRTIAYSLGLVGLWTGSVAMCTTNLVRSSGLTGVCFYFYLPDNTIDTQLTSCTTRSPGMINYWTSFASTLTSSVELILLISSTSVCYMHRRRKRAVLPSETITEMAFPLQVIAREQKVLSA